MDMTVLPAAHSHVLVVDDNLDVCTQVSEYLGRHDFRVTAVNSGKWMNVIGSEAIDLLLLELRLRGDDGLPLALNLQAMQPARRCSTPERSAWSAHLRWLRAPEFQRLTRSSTRKCWCMNYRRCSRATAAPRRSSPLSSIAYAVAQIRHPKTALLHVLDAHGCLRTSMMLRQRDSKTGEARRSEETAVSALSQ